MIEGLDIQSSGEIRSIIESAKNEGDSGKKEESLKSVETTLREKTENKYPSSQEIEEVFEDSTLEQNCNFVYKTIKGIEGVPGIDGTKIDFTKIKMLEDNDVPVWYEDSNEVQACWKPTTEQRPIDRLFGSDKKQYTGEGTLYFYLPNGNKSSDGLTPAYYNSTVIVVSTETKKGGRIDLADRQTKNNLLFKITNAYDLEKAFASDSNDLESKFMRGMKKSNYLTRFKLTHFGRSYEKVNEKKDEKLKESSEKDPHLWLIERRGDEINSRVSGEYQPLLEETIDLLGAIEKETEEKLNEVQKQNEVVKQETTGLYEEAKSSSSSDEKDKGGNSKNVESNLGPEVTSIISSLGQQITQLSEALDKLESSDKRKEANSLRTELNRMLFTINSLLLSSKEPEKDKSGEKPSSTRTTKNVGQSRTSERPSIKAIAGEAEKGAQKPVESEWSTGSINEELSNFEVLKKALKAQENDLLAEISRLKNTGRTIEATKLKERLNEIKY